MTAAEVRDVVHRAGGRLRLRAGHVVLERGHYLTLWERLTVWRHRAALRALLAAEDGGRTWPVPAGWAADAEAARHDGWH